MKKVLLITVTLICLIITRSAFADLTIEIIDTEKKVMRVSYSITDNLAGKRFLTYPSDGFDYATSSLKNISVIEKNTEQELDFVVVKAPKAQNYEALKIEYPNPIPKGGNYKLQISVEATTNGISIDSKGRHVFKYSTVHPTFFILPKGHAIVYSNFPVLVYEKQGKTVVQVKDSGNKDLLFKTRAGLVQ
ncbi:hypothetical protein JWG39_02765 [Desulforhopalus vacuolatus]|uniref:hypothetical protein n=1 Tax=Desulforhopalus vacuolatus TaxID=40414 RepID=UPI00196243B8|nr:hypothetical protein [Desulforhopalus vacuolatus]MBM9518740.1 hypothetical protein [Desulforhopalus vacuolatus]